VTPAEAAGPAGPGRLAAAEGSTEAGAEISAEAVGRTGERGPEGSGSGATEGPVGPERPAATEDAVDEAADGGRREG
jgi:hypothetical protein